MILYHGTNKRFDKFDDKTCWFTDNKAFAELYAKQTVEMDGGEPTVLTVEWDGTGGRHEIQAGKHIYAIEGSKVKIL